MRRWVLALTLIGLGAGLMGHARAVMAEEQQQLYWKDVWGFPNCYYPCSPGNPGGVKCTCTTPVYP